jgi:hypothetical protein
MKPQTFVKLALPLGVAIVGLVVFVSLHHPQYPHVRVARDVSDNPSLHPAHAKSYYDPVFVQVNHSSDFVYSVTNPITRD